MLPLDSKFMAEDIKTWAAKCNPYIQLQSGIPHEHHSIGDIKKFNQMSARRCMLKKSYCAVLGGACEDFIVTANLMGRRHDPSAVLIICELARNLT